MKRLRYLSFLVLLTSCPDDGGLAPVSALLEVAPPMVDLQTVTVGVTVEAEFTVTNRGSRPLELLGVEIDGPSIFGVPFDVETTLPPGGTVNVTIEARPDAPVPYAAELRFRSDAGDADAEVRLTGIEQPECDDGNPCTNNRFDPESNTCIIEFADGTPCTSADRCIVDSVCSEGVCLGRPKACGDGNICTRDSCRQSDGECVFQPDDSACDDGNPCTADACSEAGCLHEPVVAGTECDDGDMCSTLDACLAGECVGVPLPDDTPCDDGNSCTVATSCQSGRCVGENIIDRAEEGQIVFEIGLQPWPTPAFLHRREVSMTPEGVVVGLDHLTRNDGGLIHDITAYAQCGTEAFSFTYLPDNTNSLVRFVRRALQIDASGGVEVIVGVRQLQENGFRPETTRYRLSPNGDAVSSSIGTLGGETGWSLTPDGSFIFGVIQPPTGQGSSDTLNIVRFDREGVRLWQNTRNTGDWAEFLGVAGPRVLFWSEGRFGALDFATGALVWSQLTPFIPKEMALSTTLNLGVVRTGDPLDPTSNRQLVGVELLDGTEVFRFPAEPRQDYVPRTDPVISSDGRILLMMERRQRNGPPQGLDWVELNREGQVLSATALPYSFPFNEFDARHEDFGDDPYPTVADDGVAYVGYGNRFWAIEPGGAIRWTLEDTVNSFTGTVPLLREDGILIISRGSRTLIGVRTNGGKMDSQAWSSFRNDARRTNYTP